LSDLGDIKQPSLSIVISVRNDNYGGDFNKRLQNFVSWNTELLERYKLYTEIILVNWNPVLENNTLLNEINWPLNRSYVGFVFLDVPNAVHRSFVDEEVRKTVPLFEFVAKNAGVKRAKGQFVLCTNADIMLSEDVVREISERKLERDILYRAIRVDFKPFRSDKISEAEIEKNSTAAFLRTGSIKMLGFFGFRVGLSVAKFFDKLRRWVFSLWIFLFARKNFQEERRFIFDYPFNASGDFALMSREKWISGCWYHEDTRISTHTDSIHLLSCLSQGVKLQELSGVVFHQEHVRRFDFSEANSDMDVMFDRLLREIQNLQNNKFIPPHNSWGLEGVHLQMTQF